MDITETEQIKLHSSADQPNDFHQFIVFKIFSVKSLVYFSMPYRNGPKRFPVIFRKTVHFDPECKKFQIKFEITDEMWFNKMIKNGVKR